MKKIITIIMAMMVVACSNHRYDDAYIHAGAFDIKKGQKITEFFDDFEEPLHAYYLGNNALKWSYAVDNDRIVRYAELKDYRKPVCNLNVYFQDWKVSDAVSNCR